MRGWLPGRVLSGSLMGLGRLGGLPLRKAGQLTVSRGFVLAGGWFVWCWHEKHARCGGLLRLLWSWWSAGGGCPCVRWCVGVACCRGSGAVRPGCLTCLGLLICWGLWVGVGGLVVNCIVDASILL